MKVSTLALLLLVPLIAAGLSIIPPKSNLVYCLELSDGSVCWQMKNERFADPKIVSDGKILKISEWGAESSQLRRRWSIETGEELEKDTDFSPIVEASTDFASSKSASDLWEALPQGASLSFEGLIRVRSKLTSELVKIPEEDACSIRFVGDMAIYVSYSKKGLTSVVKAFDLKHKKQIWGFRVPPQSSNAKGGPSVSLASMPQGLLVDSGVRCWCLDISSGAIKWGADYGSKRS